MNKNINIISLIICLLLYLPINCSVAHLGSQTAEDLSPQEQFNTALKSGDIDTLKALSNKRNWAANIWNRKKIATFKNMCNTIIDQTTGDTPLHLATQIAADYRSVALNNPNPEAQINHDRMIKVMRFLIDNGAHINAQNKKGQTASHIACEGNDYLANHLLFKSGADPMIRDHAHNISLNYINSSDPEYKLYKQDFDAILHGKELPEAIDAYQVMRTKFKPHLQRSNAVRNIIPGDDSDSEKLAQVNSFDSHESETVTSDEQQTHQTKQKPLKKTEKSSQNKTIIINVDEGAESPIIVESTTEKHSVSTTNTTVRPKTAGNNKAPSSPIPHEILTARNAARDSTITSKIDFSESTKSHSEIRGL